MNTITGHYSHPGTTFKNQEIGQIVTACPSNVLFIPQTTLHL